MRRRREERREGTRIVIKNIINKKVKCEEEEGGEWR